MKLKQKVAVNLLAICALVMVMASLSHALNYTYATDVRWDKGSGVPSVSSDQRYNQASSLGDPDNLFLSLGLGGLAVFDFGVDFNAAAIVFETTNGSRAGYPESAKVYVANSAFNFGILNSSNGAAILSTDGFTYVNTISNLTESVMLDMSSLSGPFRYVLIKDVTSGGPSTDGFDINAVGVAPVPEPGTMILLGLGMAGLAIFGKRRKINKA